MAEQYLQFMSALTSEIILLKRVRVIKYPQTASFSVFLVHMYQWLFDSFIDIKQNCLELATHSS